MIAIRKSTFKARLSPMARFFLVYLLPAGLINLGNIFAYLFQLAVIRSLSVADVGAFNAIFALINVIAAPAAVLPFAISRAMITTNNINGAAGRIILCSAAAGLAIAAALLTSGALLITPLRALLRISQSETAMLALLLFCTTLLSGIAIGWLQGSLRYITSALAMAGIPALRFVFGLWLVVWWDGDINAAMMATALPGAIVFAVGFLGVFALTRKPQQRLPSTVWRDFSHFMISSSVTSLLLLGFWNLDVVTVRSMFSPEASGLYAVAAVLGRIPFLISSAAANILFSEAVRSGLQDSNSGPAAWRVLVLNLALATVLGFAAAIPLSLFAEPILVKFGGVAYSAAAPILQVLSYAMALLALLQIVVTYMLARNQHQVLWLLAIALAGFLSLARVFANTPLEVVYYLAGTVGLCMVGCLWFLFLKPSGTSKQLGTTTVESSGKAP
jgi:O-antigen/teichoic acid export membrane protein